MGIPLFFYWRVPHFPKPLFFCLKFTFLDIKKFSDAWNRKRAFLPLKWRRFPPFKNKKKGEKDRPCWNAVFKFFFSSVKEASKSYASPFCLKLPRISAGVLKQKKGKILWPIKKNLNWCQLDSPSQFTEIKGFILCSRGGIKCGNKIEKKFPSLHNLFPPFFFRKKAGKKRGGKKFFEKETFYPLSLHNYYPEKKGAFFYSPRNLQAFSLPAKKGGIVFSFWFWPITPESWKNFSNCFSFQQL